ncbi:MAG TPA: hypothetical protein VK788_01550 [Terriglobales bacterium]|jgi:hypothetical protein|nr:hypothetical protein [Terriglobales bacterium]
MRLSRPILMLALVVALAAYTLDCGAMTTPEQAMQCCSSMPCAPHGHNAQDCCKEMPSMHAPFVQPSFANGIQRSLVAVAVLTTFDEAHDVDLSARTHAEHSHAPPTVYAPASLPLRI